MIRILWIPIIAGTAVSHTQTQTGGPRELTVYSPGMKFVRESGHVPEDQENGNICASSTTTTTTEEPEAGLGRSFAGKAANLLLKQKALFGGSRRWWGLGGWKNLSISRVLNFDVDFADVTLTSWTLLGAPFWRETRTPNFFWFVSCP